MLFPILIDLLEKAQKLETHIFQIKITSPEQLKVNSSNISLLFWYIKIMDAVNNLYSEIAEYTDDLRFTLTRGIVSDHMFKNILRGFLHVFNQVNNLMITTSDLLHSISNTELLKSGRTLKATHNNPISIEDYYFGFSLDK